MSALFFYLLGSSNGIRQFILLLSDAKTEVTSTAYRNFLLLYFIFPWGVEQVLLGVFFSLLIIIHNYLFWIQRQL